MTNNLPNWQPIQMNQYLKSTQKFDAPWIKSWTETPIGKLPNVHSQLCFQEYWGFVKMRWGIGRMRYAIPPGLYGIGEPDSDSPVFVTANYKMTFDLLRRDLMDLDGWILVLDTRGINVWCAAGKGTFGIDELSNRIAMTKLSQIVKHRELIVPQLGAVGVAAHVVKKNAGFKVIYGPVYSKDIHAFIANGKKTSLAMRQIHFSLRDRLVVAPLELIPALKYLPILLLLLIIRTLVFHESWTSDFLIDSLGFLGAIISGSILMPVLLPWIPGRAFSFKGAFSGLFFALIWSWSTAADPIQWLTNGLLYPAISAYLALNFTGTSTFTSMSGVYKEMRLSLPWFLSSALIGLVLMWF